MKTRPKPYQRSAIKELVAELAAGKDAALWLPTGTGKTYVYLPVAIAAVNKGYRASILVATNLLMGQMGQKYLPNFRTTIKPYYAKGVEHYNCLLTKDSADYGICTPEQRELCQVENHHCMVLHTNRQLGEYAFIVTNFHKFLSVPTQEHFDLVVIDDSHGFENAVDDKFQTRMTYYQVDEFYRRHEQLNDSVSDFAGVFLDLFDSVLGAIPPSLYARRIPDDDVKRIAEIKEYDELWDQMRNLEEVDRRTCRGLLYFVRSCRNATLNTFYVQKDYYSPNDPHDSVLVARKSETFQSNVIRSIFGESRVLFVSATPGEIATHASYCTRREYAANTISTIPKVQPRAVRDWFKGLRIFETQDFPEKGEDSIEKGAQISAQMLAGVPGKALLLFKNYRDQRRAENVLKKAVNREITFIDDSFETETVQDLVEKADIIMATASSRLWEGIDISDLKLEIIFSLPFIRPPIHLEQHESFLFSKRKMLIRLQQGIGRLVRKEGGLGVCVVLDRRLDKYKNSSNFSDAFRQQIRSTSIARINQTVKRVLR
jgi:ATP-dependent DNA helicase DinG